MSATWEEFERLRTTVGVVTEVEDFSEARVPADKLTIDFGSDIGTKRSSAQLTRYAKEDLLGRNVVCVLGFVPKRIAGFPSEVLVLGAYSAEHGVVLLRPDREVEPGSADRVSGAARIVQRASS
jgi:tRNA-binding protein